MTKLNYLEEDAALIVENLPEGFEATAETAPLFLIYAVLMRAKGIYTTLEDVHDAWAAWRSTTNPNHSDLVPFGQLTKETRALDRPFLHAIHAAAHIRNDQTEKES